MKLLHTTSIATLAALLLAPALYAQNAAAPASAEATANPEGLETIIVTAQKREVNIQDAPLAITALSAATVARARILNVADLAHTIVGISFTANSPQANEINIRGVVNTRLSAPSADQSVSIFVDDVFVSRAGNLNSAYYDVGRIEVVRGPQGVLLGKNVAGGAVLILSAAPENNFSGRLTGTVGNHGLYQSSGFVNAAVNDEVATRLSFQTINTSGFAKDLYHDVNLEDLQSVQLRGQVQIRPTSSSFTGLLIVDYSKDSSNGPNRVAVPDPVLTGARPWSTGRAQIGVLRGNPLTIRESYPVWPQFKGEAAPSPQNIDRETWSAIVNLQTDVTDNVRLTSISGYRGANAYILYDQTGLGPVNPYNVITTLLFAEPVNFQENVQQFSQELRLTSHYTDSKWDWILGGYGLHNKVTQRNRFWGQTPFQPGGRAPGVLGALSGESHWTDSGTNKDIAGFGQIGYSFTPALKIELGLRYTHDNKGGDQSGVAIATGDIFVPTDPKPLTPLTVLAFSTPYDASWNKWTPQATLSYNPNPDLFAYATFSQGFKGGGFQNNAPNAFAAAQPYNPESLNNYEVGLKLQFLDGRARLNTAVFYMDYSNLQVQQTSAACLCNIINNASSATIKGIESEFQISPVHWLRAWVNGSYVDAKYNKFVDTNGVNNEGHFLQRTPQYQVALGAEVTTDLGSWTRALQASLNYKYQGKMYWSPDNLTQEGGFGILDGRVSLAIPGGKWSVSMWGKNITNTEYRTNIIAFFGDQVSSYGAPFTFGGDVTFKF